MMVFRILLFSMLAALLLYVPFYHFAPLYRSLYTHVPAYELNWWMRGNFAGDFAGEHGGIQIYLAYVLMFLAIGLTVCFEFLYLRFISPRARWIVLAIGATSCFFYLWNIGFSPPMADARPNGQGILFITGAAATAFIFGRFLGHKAVKVSLIILLFFVCMVPALWAFMVVDHFYVLYPALRTVKGYALNQSYFQYDHVISLLAMLWMKMGLPADRFLNVIDFFYLVFFAGIYVLAKNLFFDKRLAVYFILSLVIIKIYGNLAPTINCPQVSPLRLDLWLIVLGLAYWRGPEDWTVGMAFGFFLVFHHAFGMIYAVSYALLIVTLLVLKISKGPKEYLPNAFIMLGGMLIYQIFISSNNIVPGMNYVKYNIGFMPIDPRSFFWYVPVVASMATLLLWKNHTQTPNPPNGPSRYFQAGIFLVLLAIGNLLYFFGRSHENNLINIAAILWLVFFMLIDLVFHRMSQKYAGAVKKFFVPLAGVFIVGLVAYFYSSQAVDRIKEQMANLPRIADLFKASKGIDLDFNTLKKITRGNPDIVFLSVNREFEYYYYGGYTPLAPTLLDAQFFEINLMNTLNKRLLRGADIIVPLNEADSLQENTMLIDAKFNYRISDFVYISNNQPAL